MKALSMGSCLAAAFCFMTACGGDDDNDKKSGVDIATLFPANNAVGSWIEDTTAVGFIGPNPAGIETETTNDGLMAAINGDADAFIAHHFVAFGREFYTDGTYKLELRVWQWQDNAAAKSLYTGLLTEDARYGGVAWNALAAGEVGRIADTGNAWWLNVVKGSYMVEILGLSPNSAAGQTAGETFLAAVLAKIP